MHYRVECTVVDFRRRYRLGRVSAFLQGATLLQLYDWKMASDADLSRHTRLITFPKKLRVVPTCPAASFLEY